MKFYGNANLQQNELQAAVLPIEDSFPVGAKVGRLAFVNSILYICVSITNNLPVWVPLTHELTMYTFTQDVPSATWNITHGLNTTSVQVQIIDDAGHVLIPDEITIIDGNNVVVTLGTAIIGKAVVLTGHTDGVARSSYAFTYYQNSASATWDIRHNLGYPPIARVFIGNAEVQPQGIEHVSNNEMIITFSQPYAGLAKLV